MAACPFNRHLDEWSSTRSMKFYILQQWISLPLSLPLTHSLSGCDLATWLRCNPLPHDMSWAISVGCQATGPALDPRRRRRRAAWPRALQNSRLLTLTHSQQLHQAPRLPFTTLWWSAVTRNPMRSTLTHSHTQSITGEVMLRSVHRFIHSSAVSLTHHLLLSHLNHTQMDGPLLSMDANACKWMLLILTFSPIQSYSRVHEKKKKVWVGVKVNLAFFWSKYPSFSYCDALPGCLELIHGCTQGIVGMIT